MWIVSLDRYRTSVAALLPDRRILRSVILVAILAWPALAAQRAAAWGDDGHKIICAIANSLLSEAQRNEVQRLVNLYRPGEGTPYRYFTAACAFADVARANGQAGRSRTWARFKRFDNWHFMNVSRQANRATQADCHDDCVLKGIAQHRERLADPRLKDWERAEALILLAHWVGDIHQPLHVSYGDDLGGTNINRIKGDYYRSRNLHSVWDSGIINKARGRRDWLEYGKALMNVDAVQRRSWESSSPLDWANESYAIAIEQETDYCELRGGSCRSEGRTRTLTERYQHRFQPVVEVRLRQAGVRLAKVIAEALK